MAVFPDEMHAIAMEEALAHPNEICQAIRDTNSRIRALPSFRATLDQMVQEAAQQLVCQARANLNREQRGQPPRQRGGHSEPRVRTGQASATAYRSHYLYNIAGRTLGALLGSELLPLAATEQAHGRTRLAHAALLRALAPLTPADRTVQEAVPERRLNALWRRHMQGADEAA